MDLINQTYSHINQMYTKIKRIDDLERLDVELESDREFKLIERNMMTKLTSPSCLDYSCIQCRSLGAISWGQCKHRYCSECISQILNESLTLRNEIPKCPECFTTFNTQKLSECLLKCSYPEKYKIKITFKQYSNMDKLINGYIRSTYHIIPNGLILSIFDFYHLNYVKPVKCDKCVFINKPLTEPALFPPFIEHMTFCQASNLQVDHQIDHRDHVGRFIAATIIEQKGTNLKIHYNGWSRKWDTWCDFTAQLYRFAKFESISKRPAHRFLSIKKGGYIDINAIHRQYGWTYTQIRRFDTNSGQVQVVYNRNDKHYLYWVHLDNQYEVAPFSKMCKQKLDCDDCSLVLDFNQICRKQKVCIKCNEFHPLDCIIYWPQCKHVLCINCLMMHATDKLLQNIIPICLAIDCHNCIAKDENEINGHNLTFLYHTWQKTSQYTSHMSYCWKALKLLLHRQDRFKCSICNKWHKDVDMFINKNTNCQHKYSNICYSYLMYTTDCGHSDCLKCLAKCEICQNSDENRYLFAWTTCGHKYHKRCAKKYINQWLSKQPNILTVLSTQYITNNNMIPLCVNKRCNGLLDVHSAELMGATRYQCTMLYELRKKSILIDSKNIEIIHRYEPIDKQTLINQDFSLIQQMDLNS